MTDTDQTAHRSLYTPPSDEVAVRDAEEMDAEDGLMEIRLPIASTGEVRNEGDDPLTRDELAGMADQINTNTVGVFPEHGKSSVIDTGRYSQHEKMGYWTDADVESTASDDGEDLLMATARMPDPESLPQATGDYREALAVYKEQAKRGIPLSASIGWSDDDTKPGGVDLLEASVVGIGADQRTTTEGGTEALARAAVAAGADPDDFVDEVRAIVDDTRAPDTDSERPLGPPGDRDRFESFDECVATLSEDDDVSTEDAETICGAWENASRADTDSEHDMTDEDDPGDDAGTTDEEQDASGGETTERAPDDVTPSDLAAVVAASYDGVDAGDLVDAWDDMGDFTGGVDLDALVGLVATATGSDTGTVENAMDALLSEEQSDDMDEDKDDEDDEGEDDQSADAPDAEQDADTSDLEARLAELEEDLEKVRSGDVDVDVPDADPDEEQRADDADDATDADTDTENDRATAGPNWRA